AVSVGAGYLTAGVAMRRLLVPLILLVSRITDPILAQDAYLGPVRRTVLEPRIRAIVVAAVFAAVLVRIGIGERPHLLDEMDIGVLAAWVGVGALAVRLSLERFWPAARPGDTIAGV